MIVLVPFFLKKLKAKVCQDLLDEMSPRKKRARDKLFCSLGSLSHVKQCSTNKRTKSSKDRERFGSNVIAPSKEDRQNMGFQ